MREAMIPPQSSDFSRCRTSGDAYRPGPDDRPFFSVITASLNSRRTLAAALESVQKQSFTGVEHIVIDGGSTDGTIEILKRHEKGHGLRWSSEPDGGLADAMNKGVRAARGRYIIFIHADDALADPGVLEWVHKRLYSQRYAIGCFPILFAAPDGSLRRVAPIRLRGWHRFRNTIRHQGCFVHYRLYERIGTFNTRYSICMDYDFFYRALHYGASLRYFRRPVAVMGREGVSSDPRFLLKRLQEEHTIQMLNEKNPLWRAAQLLFHRLYIPYKTRRFGRPPQRPGP